jgi:hypothetical protein
MVDKTIIVENKIKEMENNDKENIVLRTVLGKQHPTSLASVRAFL